MTIGLPDHAVRVRLARAMDTEARIPAALQALGPVAERDVAVVDPVDGGLITQLLGLGSWVRAVPDISSATIGAVPDARADVLVAGWVAFRPGTPEWEEQLAQARRVLRPDGRLLVIHDYGRDDVTQLLGDAEHATELTAWSRPNGPFLRLGFRIRVLHCWWRWATIDEATEVLTLAFGDTGATVAASLRRPRLSWKVAIYHLAMDPDDPKVAPSAPTAHVTPSPAPAVGGGSPARVRGLLAAT